MTVKRTKLAIVTGATSGIGTHVGQVLAAAGVRVFLIGRNPQKLAAAVGRIPARRRAGVATVDLRSSTDIKRLLGEIRQRFARIDILVHCAGEYHRSAPGSTNADTFDLMFEGIRTALKSSVQQSIQLAEKNGEALEAPSNFFLFFSSKHSH